MRATAPIDPHELDRVLSTCTEHGLAELFIFYESAALSARSLQLTAAQRGEWARRYEGLTDQVRGEMVRRTLAFAQQLVRECMTSADTVIVSTGPINPPVRAKLYLVPMPKAKP